MTVSEFEAEPQSKEDTDQSVLMDNTVKAQSPSVGSKRNPPARNTSRFWFERFLAVIQRQNPSVIDASFVSQIAPSNEGKLLAQLKFLRVVDEQGKPTQLLPLLNMVGEEQKKAFQEIAQGSYKDLFQELNVDRAVPDDLVNFFIRKYGFTRDKAINASKFFLYLTEKGSIHISPELSTFLTDKSTPSQANGSQISGPRPIDRPVIRLPSRESKTVSIPSQSRQFLQRKKGVIDNPSEHPSIQTMISIRLDKDTPREYWDRVLALIGEKKLSAEVQIGEKTPDQDSSESLEGVDQELTPDSNFT
ncbi:MAG: hypothetical protein ACHQ1H_10135 [Nitrososphaerales archaeon]